MSSSLAFDDRSASHVREAFYAGEIKRFNPAVASKSKCLLFTDRLVPNLMNLSAQGQGIWFHLLRSIP